MLKKNKSFSDFTKNWSDSVHGNNHPTYFYHQLCISSLPFCCLDRKTRRNNFIMLKPPVLRNSLYRQLGTSVESYLPESSHTASVHGFGAIKTHILFVPQGGSTWLWPFSVSTELYWKDHDSSIPFLNHFLKCILRWSSWTVSV